MKRFQEFATNWEEGEYVTPLVPIENIKTVPIAFFTATNDTNCPLEIVKEHIARIGSQTTRIDVEGEDHGYFQDSANSDWFME